MLPLFIQFFALIWAYLHAEFHLPISNGSLITVIELIAKYTFLAFTTFLFIILQKNWKLGKAFLILLFHKVSASVANTIVVLLLSLPPQKFVRLSFCYYWWRKLVSNYLRDCAITMPIKRVMKIHHKVFEGIRTGRHNNKLNTGYYFLKKK